jgi:hypothetical protein
VRPMKNARQRFSRTAKVSFPVVEGSRYYQYQVGTTDRVELTKTKFEFHKDSGNSI